MTVWQVFQSGGPLMWPLLLCSLVVVTLILERSLFWFYLEKERNRSLVDEVLHLAEVDDWLAIRDKTKDSHDFVIRILVVGIVHRQFCMAKAMQAEAEVSIQRMQRSMPALDTMITVAPLLGILGTVLGIISSFEVLGSGGLSDPRAVTGGIAQALVTTATGLAISIVTVVPYNFFNSRIGQAVHVMEKYATSLEVVYQKNEAGQGGGFDEN